MEVGLEAGRPRIAILLYDGLTALDFIAPHQAWAMFADVFLVSRDGAPITTDSAIVIHATHCFETCPEQLDVFFVPGGMATFDLMLDVETIEFVRAQGEQARYVTSVCNGAMVLGAAGLLDGYRAATHWATRHMLGLTGDVEVVPDRVVIDRNRLTGGGVTAGLDFGLTVLARLQGEQVAKNAQLILEYNPAPPFNAGHPSVADEETIAQVKAFLSQMDDHGLAQAREVKRQRALTA
ncbi:DJ-1/PfpI family protein [Sphingomonadaceae bacterium jetA1]|jgi:cyclohexyl-isocyanide hydratase|uniref:DJ-1/PfpI family protein n=1 Tax=Facivitalis istanbulensis TaxID=3075838 RepID=UPI00346EB821